MYDRGDDATQAGRRPVSGRAFAILNSSHVHDDAALMAADVRSTSNSRAGLLARAMSAHAISRQSLRGLACLPNVQNSRLPLTHHQ